jgi:hypothetical protein
MTDTHFSRTVARPLSSHDVGAGASGERRIKDKPQRQRRNEPTHQTPPPSLQKRDESRIYSAVWRVFDVVDEVSGCRFLKRVHNAWWAVSATAASAGRGAPAKVSAAPHDEEVYMRRHPLVRAALVSALVLLGATAVQGCSNVACAAPAGVSAALDPEPEPDPVSKKIRDSEGCSNPTPTPAFPTYYASNVRETP